MNYKVVLSILGKAMLIEAALLLAPFLVGLYYEENVYQSFLIPIAILLVLGVPLSCLKQKDKSIYAKEGFVIVAFAWIVLSVVGCIPFMISGVIPDFASALLETVSGFTTTGASALDSVECFGVYLPIGWAVWVCSCLFLPYCRVRARDRCTFSVQSLRGRRPASWSVKCATPRVFFTVFTCF